MEHTNTDTYQLPPQEAPAEATPPEQPGKKKREKVPSAMKVLGTDQFKKKKFNLMTIGPEFAGIIGPETDTAFLGLIFGPSGQGKSNLAIQLLKYYLNNHEDAAWIDYEEMHRFSLQKAINRHLNEPTKHNVRWVNPLAKMKLGMNLIEELDKYLMKPSTPNIIIINSLNYLRMTMPEYYAWAAKHRDRKIIWLIGHEKNGEPDTVVGRKMMYDGDIAIRVNKFMAWPTNKNRYEGRTPFVIYEEEARKQNPLHFGIQPAPKAAPKKRGPKPKNKGGKL